MPAAASGAIGSVERRLRDEIWTLQEENRWLRDMLRSPDFLPAIFPLTASEERLFTALMSRERWERHELIRSVYSASTDREYTTSNTVDVCICHIRRKLKPLGIEIESLYGFGYRINPKMKTLVSDICKREREREEKCAAAICNQSSLQT